MLGCQIVKKLGGGEERKGEVEMAGRRKKGERGNRRQRRKWELVVQVKKRGRRKVKRGLGTEGD